MKKRQDGRYSTSFTLEGKKYYIYGDSIKEVRKKVEEKKKAIKEGSILSDNITLDSYFYNIYIENKKGIIAESSINTYLGKYMAQVSPYFGKLKIKSIKRPDIIQFQKHLLETPNTRNGKLYTPRGVNLTITFLSGIFNDAIKNGYISSNPVLAIQRPKDTTPKVKENIHRALTDEEINTFFEICKDSHYINYFKLLLATGMRCGELSAISIKDIDFIEKTVSVHSTISKDRDGDYYLSPVPKTNSGNRKIPLTEEAERIFKLQITQNKYTRDLENIYNPLVFINTRGDLLRPSSMGKLLEVYCDKAKLKRFGTHCFRATFATRCAQSGMKPEVLMKILGHSEYSTTIKYYISVSEEEKAKELRKVKFHA